MPEYVLNGMLNMRRVQNMPKYGKVLNMAGFSICERYTAFWICQNMQSSEYILGSKYARVLNIQELHRVLNMPQYSWICLNRT